MISFFGLYSILTWQFVALQIGIYIAICVINRRYFASISDIPGPFLASFSRLWHVVHIVRGDHSAELIKLHSQHGHFVRISHSEVSVSHPDAVERVLLSSFVKAPWYKVMAVPDYRFQNPMSILEPKLKQEKSRLFSPAYTFTNLLQAEDNMDRLIESFMACLDRGGKLGTPMHLDRFISYATYDIAAEMAFSKPFGFLKAGLDIQNTLANNLLVNMYVTVAGHFHWLHTLLVGNPIISKTGLLPVGHLYSTITTALDQRRKNPDARFDMVAHWFRAQANHPDVLKTRDVYAHATISVPGGSDTVAIAIQSFIYHTIRHKNVYARLRQEIDAARNEDRCTTSIVSFADARKLPYLQACIKEAMRVFGPVGLSLARVVGDAGLDINGRKFRKGTLLSVNPWVMHSSKECWGPDADIFDPDRWLRETIPAQQKNFIPFGAGFASCPGQNLAQIEVSKICATIVRDYDICLASKNQKWSWRAYFTVVPHSWPVSVQKRAW